jgi:hypothetical protein
MLVVSLVLAAVLLTGGEGDSAASEVAGAAGSPVTATPISTVEPTSTPLPTPVPSIPFALQERVNALPEKLRNETTYAYATGTLTLDQLEQIVSNYENRNPSVRVGSVLSIDGNTLSFEVFTTGELAAVVTGEQTLIRRGDAAIALDELRPEELVMVVSTAEGRVALTIEAFGVAAP